MTKRDTYMDDLPEININDFSKLNINKSPKDNKTLVIPDNKPRENEFLKDFCIWRKSQGLFVPVSWEK